MPFLPFHCPITGTNHLLEPCTKNLARVKALKLAKKHVGPLERCVECKGKKLITKPQTVIEGLPAPENWVEREYVTPEQKGWNPNPEVTTAPLFLKDVGKNHGNPVPPGDICPDCNQEIHFFAALGPGYADGPRKICGCPNKQIMTPFNVGKKEMRKLSPEKIAQGRAAVKRLTESYKLGKKEPKNEEIVPELPKKHEGPSKDAIIIPEGERWELPLPKKASDIVRAKPEVLEQRVLEGKVPQKQEEIVPAVKITEKEAAKLGLGAPFHETPLEAISPPIQWKPDPALEVRYCPTHPEVLQRVDKLGRFMGMCTECLAIRGRKCGLENSERGFSVPPMSIPLNLPKYAPVKEWLMAQAEEHEQTLTGAIMYILKKAWRQGI